MLRPDEIRVLAQAFLDAEVTIAERQRTMAEPVTDEEVWRFLDAAKVHGIKSALESFAARRRAKGDAMTAQLTTITPEVTL